MTAFFLFASSICSIIVVLILSVTALMNLSWRYLGQVRNGREGQGREAREEGRRRETGDGRREMEGNEEQQRSGGNGSGISYQWYVDPHFIERALTMQVG